MSEPAHSHARRVLVLFAHPSLEHSEVNRPMMEVARVLPGITLVVLEAHWNESAEIRQTTDLGKRGPTATRSEPPRVLRRLEHLREWSHEQVKQVFT